MFDRNSRPTGAPTVTQQPHQEPSRQPSQPQGASTVPAVLTRLPLNLADNDDENIPPVHRRRF